MQLKKCLFQTKILKIYMKLFCIKNQNKLINKKVQKRLKKYWVWKIYSWKNVTKIEDQLKKRVKSKYCITTSSGTDALLYP